MPVILLVEDDPFIRKLVSYLLKQNGFQVRIAETGEEALHVVGQERVDLILMDLMLPGMDGYKVCHHLKADPDTKDIPIVILSAKSQEEQRDRAGAAAYIAKPFDPKELVERIWEILYSAGPNWSGERSEDEAGRGSL